MNIDISQLGYRWKGIYSPNLSYANNDVVYKNGGAYVIRNGVPVEFALGQQDAVLRGALATGAGGITGFGNMVLHSNGAGGVEFRFQDTRNGTLAVQLGDTYNPGGYYQSYYGISAIMHDGSVRSWGYQDNGYGGAGDAGDIGRTSPTRAAFPPGTPAIVKIRHCWDHTYYIDAEGGFWHSGINNQFMSCVGAQCNIPTKINGYGDIAADTKIVDVATGNNWYSNRQGFAIDDQGRVYAFGTNNYESQGITGTSEYPRIVPFTIDTPIAKAISSGINYAGSALISREGQLWIAGHIDLGSMGMSSSPHNLFAPWGLDQPVKTVVYTESDDSSTTTSSYYRSMLMLLENGDLYASGINGSSGWGIGATTNAYWDTATTEFVTPPKILSNVKDASTVNGNTARIIALMNDGTIQGTGYDGYGQLGGGGNTTTWRQISPDLLTNCTMLKFFGAATGGSAYVLRDDGTVVGWGRNQYGVFGVGNDTDGPAQGPALLDKTVVDFQITGQCYYSTSNQTLHMLTSDGQVFSSGSGIYSVNGDDDSEAAYVPRQIIF